MLDADTMMVTNDVARDVGFLTGFGIDTPNKKVWARKRPPHFRSRRHEGFGARRPDRDGESAQKDPKIGLVYSMNEQAAAGAAQALKAAGRTDVISVSVDGTCQGIEMVKNGTIQATAMQFWLDMVKDAMVAADDQIKTGKKPVNTPGLDYVDTGVKLLTAHPVEGVPSVDPDEALKLRGAMCTKS